MYSENALSVSQMLVVSFYFDVTIQFNVSVNIFIAFILCIFLNWKKDSFQWILSLNILRVVKVWNLENHGNLGKVLTNSLYV